MKFLAASLIALLLCTLPNLLIADTLLVPEDYDTIQDALDIAAADDIVSVAEGDYVENLEFLASGVTLLSRDPLAATIDGDGDDAVFLDGYDGVVSGFVIKNGNRGIYSRDNDVEIYGNVITDCDYGIECRDVTAVIANNVVSSNFFSGIIISDGISVDITSNTLIDHPTNLILRSSDATVTNNINTQAGTGTHIYLYDVTLIDTINITEGSLPAGTDFEANYNLNWDNGSDYRATGQMGTDPFGFPGLTVTNAVDVGGIGELFEDPILDTLGGYQVLAGSPCIDAGDNEALSDDLDLDVVGEDRLVDDIDTDDTGAGTAPIIDIGAFEFQEAVEPEFLRGDANVNGVLTIADAVVMLEGLYLDGPIHCDDAIDATDNGLLDVGDPIRLLMLLFLDGDDLPAPYPDCGTDDTDDDLGCQTLLFCD